MPYTIISFYKYVPLKHPHTLQNYLKLLCQDYRILGRILLANEGINGAVCGTKEDIEEFTQSLKRDERLSDMTFCEQSSDQNAYHKIVVRVRPEIVHFGVPVDMTLIGQPLTPAALKELYDTQKDFVIIDARNQHEALVGKFKNALTLPIENFRDFPKALPQLTPYKNKKVVLYCTGGVRCEKASAYLKQQGFPDVNQLQGGIINYLNQYPHTYWEGGLFVFDDRIVSPAAKPIAACQLCNTPCDHYINCHNLNCDALFICCDSCQQKMDKTCSEKCRKAPRQRPLAQPAAVQKITLGVVENYYAKAKVALIRIQHQPLPKNTPVEFTGNTTHLLSHTITQMHDYEGHPIDTGHPGQLVTFPLDKKVRKHDMMMTKI